MFQSRELESRSGDAVIDMVVDHGQRCAGLQGRQDVCVDMLDPADQPVEAQMATAAARSVAWTVTTLMICPAVCAPMMLADAACRAATGALGRVREVITIPVHGDGDFVPVGWFGHAWHCSPVSDILDHGDGLTPGACDFA